MKRISPNETVKAICDYRRVLELNGHKPTTQDSRDAVAQAQLEADQKDHNKKVREIFEEIEELDVGRSFYLKIWQTDYQALKEKYLGGKR